MEQLEGTPGGWGGFSFPECIYITDFEAPAKAKVAVVFVLQKFSVPGHILMYIFGRSEGMEEILAFKASGFSICRPWYLGFLLYFIVVVAGKSKRNITYLWEQ